MNTLYCNLGGSGNKTLQVADLRTTGMANHEAHSTADLYRIIFDLDATHVSFNFAFMPRKAIAVMDAKLDSYIDKLVRRMGMVTAR